MNRSKIIQNAVFRIRHVEAGELRVSLLAFVGNSRIPCNRNEYWSNHQSDNRKGLCRHAVVFNIFCSMKIGHFNIFYVF
jgi:hypothetical protein